MLLRYKVHNIFALYVKAVKSSTQCYSGEGVGVKLDSPLSFSLMLRFSCQTQDVGEVLMSHTSSF